MNQPCFLASFFLNLRGEIPVKGVRVVVPLLSLRVEVDAGPPSDHVNDSAIRLISEVFLFGCLG
jgi:hypothetical protein